MRLIFLAAFITFFALVCLALRAIYQKAQARTRKWEMEPRETADSTEIWVVKRGVAADFIGRALRSLPDYDDKLYELTSEAEEQASMRNAAQKVLSAKR